MIKPRRISLELFDNDLKTLINASAKIFPMSQEEIDNNLNPKGYEYAKVGRKIYVWENGVWDYVIADDIDIKYGDIKELPQEFNPKKHTHNESEISNLDKYTKSEVDNKLSSKADKTELHNHSNKSTLDTIVQALIDKWNSAYNHISDLVKHVTQADKDKWNTVTDKSDKTYVDTEFLKKADKTYVDTELAKKSDNTHNHDGAYYKKAEVDVKLNNKSNIDHAHIVYEEDIGDLDTRLYMIENGYTEGHAHDNLSILNNLEDNYGELLYKGNSLSGSSVVYLTCDTPSTTVAKVINNPDYELKINDVLAIKFTLGTSVSVPTLDINGVGAKKIRLGSTDANTTVLTVGVDGVVLMYYDGEYFQMMGSYRTTDSVEDSNMGLTTLQVGEQVTRYKLLMEGVDGRYYPLTIGDTTSTNKTVSTREFRISRHIIYYGSTTVLAENATSSSFYSEVNMAYMNYNFNQSGGYVLYRPIFLVGYINENGNFILDNSTLTSWYTQDLPDKEDGKVYIYIGYVYSTNSLRLQIWNEIYEYKDGKVVRYIPTHKHDDRYYVKAEIDTKLLSKSDSNHTHTDKADKTYVDTELAKKVNSTTFNGHVDSTTIHVTQTDKNNWNAKANLSDMPTSLPANGGNADTVGGFTVGVSVPANANFSNTTYSEITTAEIDAGTASTLRTITGRRVKYIVDKIPTKLSQLEIDVPTGGITIGSVKPTNGSMWYEVIG